MDLERESSTRSIEWLSFKIKQTRTKTLDLERTDLHLTLDTTMAMFTTKQEGFRI